jgi:hypothetical protein
MTVPSRRPFLPPDAIKRVLNWLRGRRGPSPSDGQDPYACVAVPLSPRPRPLTGAVALPQPDDR